MKFLIDEDVPLKLLKILNSLGHDCIRAKSASSDMEVADFAKSQDRILVTLDKDFTNTGLFPPSKFKIIHIHIHPPYANPITEALLKLLKMLPPEEYEGLTVLREDGHTRIVR